MFLYVAVGSLVVARLLLYPLRPADLTPPYWVAMGATAITVLAGAHIVEMADAPMAIVTSGLGGAGGAGGVDGAIGRGGWFIGTGGMATIGGGGNRQSIVIDFVRHGQTPGNAAMLIDTAVPGPGLTALGQQQAQAIANALAAKGPYAGIFDSQLIRTQQTAAPLAFFKQKTAYVITR